MARTTQTFVDDDGNTLTVSTTTNPHGFNQQIERTGVYEERSHAHGMVNNGGFHFHSEGKVSSSDGDVHYLNLQNSNDHGFTDVQQSQTESDVFGDNQFHQVSTDNGVNYVLKLEDSKPIRFNTHGDDII